MERERMRVENHLLLFHGGVGMIKKNTDTHTHTLGELTDTFKLNLYAFFNQLILFYLSIYFFTKHTSDHYFHP